MKDLQTTVTNYTIMNHKSVCYTDAYWQVRGLIFSVIFHKAEKSSLKMLHFYIMVLSR